LEPGTLESRSSALKTRIIA